jgi:ligand-binding SRPBCC domain-containing protein
MSKVYTLKTKQRLPLSLEIAWDFFSSPKNLKEITPKHMGFVIKGDIKDVEKMYTGQIINYTVKPIAGIPLAWTTEISHVQHHEYFVDNQRFGPYAMWHHKHFFKAIEGGVEMEDIVHYKLPLGFLGDIANALFVKAQLKGIFDYRFSKLHELFGEYDKGSKSNTILY